MKKSLIAATAVLGLSAGAFTLVGASPNPKSCKGRITAAQARVSAAKDQAFKHCKRRDIPSARRACDAALAHYNRARKELVHTVKQCKRRSHPGK